MENYYWAALGAAKELARRDYWRWSRLLAAHRICMKRRKRTFSQRGLFLKKALRSLRNAERTTGTFRKSCGSSVNGWVFRLCL